jgi:hypothetical protein
MRPVQAPGHLSDSDTERKNMSILIPPSPPLHTIRRFVEDLPALAPESVALAAAHACVQHADYSGSPEAVARAERDCRTVTDGIYTRALIAMRKLHVSRASLRLARNACPRRRAPGRRRSRTARRRGSGRSGGDDGDGGDHHGADGALGSSGSHAVPSWGQHLAHGARAAGNNRGQP